MRIDMRKVAPFVGAWIEIGNRQRSICPKKVAPFVGAWIEIWKSRSTT